MPSTVRKPRQGPIVIISEGIEIKNVTDVQLEKELNNGPVLGILSVDPEFENLKKGLLSLEC
ncbi:hypothetical protein MANES_04G146976v8 [Manihot esculenta]|uniref:Uncharacterized protein n=1 Tax=Manihot esculenta TaxID=3983 RepID=A0ACB7HUN7_MANES|nr:hypothetical protein MANES_04G146976v8 [Manihot esculenta]